MSNQNQPPQGGEQAAQRPNGRMPAAFTVEFGDDYCHNFIIRTPPFEQTVRGEFSLSRLGRRPEGMRDVGADAMKIPDLAGMRLAVDPRKGTATLFDPLLEGKGAEALARYNGLAKKVPSLNEYKALDPVTKQVNQDQLKTLILELRQKRENKQISIVEGEFPNDSEIEAMPGRELFDSMNSGRKPKYKDEFEGWIASPAGQV